MSKRDSYLDWEQWLKEQEILQTLAEERARQLGYSIGQIVGGAIDTRRRRRRPGSSGQTAFGDPVAVVTPVATPVVTRTRTETRRRRETMTTPSADGRETHTRYISHGAPWNRSWNVFSPSRWTETTSQYFEGTAGLRAGYADLCLTRTIVSTMFQKVPDFEGDLVPNNGSPPVPYVVLKGMTVVYRIKNFSNCGVELDLYDLECTGDMSFNDSKTDPWVSGPTNPSPQTWTRADPRLIWNAAVETEWPGNASSFTKPWWQVELDSHPWRFRMFRETWKTAKHSRIWLGPGEVHMHRVFLNRNRLLDGTRYVDYTVAGAPTNLAQPPEIEKGLAYCFFFTATGGMVVGEDGTAATKVTTAKPAIGVMRYGTAKIYGVAEDYSAQTASGYMYDASITNPQTVIPETGGIAGMNEAG